MRSRLLRVRKTLLLWALLLSAPALADDLQRFASIGDFQLENGGTIRDCRIGYRTFGTLAEDRSNVVVLTTWFAGRASDIDGWIGPGKLFDTSRFFVVTIDALGDGVSSSPSNSALQPEASFPRFTIGDMVRSQHRLLTKDLGLTRVHAIAGSSMGGMQSLEWVVAFPDFMERAIAIVPTPKQTASDLLLWQTELDLLESFSGSPADMRKAMRIAGQIQSLELWTPSWLARSWKVEEAPKRIEERRKSFDRLDPWDYMSQLRAMIGHDVYRRFEGSAERASKAIRAKLLIVVAEHDQMVNPAPAIELARLTGAELLTLSNDCGHLAPGCEWDVVTKKVQGFVGGDCH